MRRGAIASTSSTHHSSADTLSTALSRAIFSLASAPLAKPSPPYRSNRAIYLGCLLALLTASLQLHAATAATMTTLTISPGTAVSVGTVVTLTATVTNPAGVTRGTVIFCDPSAATCIPGAGLYGTAQLTNSGTAMLRTRFGVGAHNIVAVFRPTKKNSKSISPPSVVNATPAVIYSSVTALSAFGDLGDYTLTGSVSAFGSQPLDGSISLNYLTGSHSQITSAPLSNETIQLSQATPYSVGIQPLPIVVGDLNGDGLLDLMIANENDNDVSVMLGNPDGTFQPQRTFAVGQTPESIAVGDFNNDGILDLAVANTLSNTVSILLGNGDGSFRPQTTIPAGRGPTSVVTEDFNSDGNLDLVVVNTADANLSVSLGKGDGTFQSPMNYATGNSPTSAMVGDFNGDGSPDLVVANTKDNTISLLISNNDGTFQSERTVATGIGPYSIAIGDFNGDGDLDLATTNRNGNTVSVILGNGNGTLQNQLTYATGIAPDSIVVGDFNGDGKSDLAIANQLASAILIMIGDGDGTFQPLTTYQTGFIAQSLAVGDFNGDGIIDLASTDLESMNVQLGRQTATYNVTGVSVLGSGPEPVVANYPGDGTRSASQSAPVLLDAALGSPEVFLTSVPNPSSYGVLVTLSSTVTGANGTPPTGTVTFKDGTTILGSGTMAGGTATIAINSLSLGLHIITAIYSGDSNYASATSLPMSQTVNKSQAAITLTSSVNPSTYGNALTFTATLPAEATGSITFLDGNTPIGSGILNTSGVATMSIATLSAGSHTITAVYSGDSHFQ